MLVRPSARHDTKLTADRQALCHGLKRSPSLAAEAAASRALHTLGTPRSSAAVIACISLNGYMLIVML